MVFFFLCSLDDLCVNKWFSWGAGMVENGSGVTWHTRISRQGDPGGPILSIYIEFIGILRKINFIYTFHGWGVEWRGVKCTSLLVRTRPGSYYFQYLDDQVTIQLPDPAMSQKTDPSKFLSSIIGSSVVVKLHNGVQYLGNLQSIDGFMNVALDGAKELVGEKEGRSFNDVFIRGNNGMLRVD